VSHPSNKVTIENVDDIFTYHHEEWKIKHYNEIRAFARSLAATILDNAPDCADRDTALRKLRECVMAANAAVALAKDPWSLK